MSDAGTIIQIDTLRIDRNRKRKCICDPYDKKFTVDSVNREITCECGMIVDPFEAMEYLANHYELLNEQHRRLYDQRQEWIKTKPYSVLFKDLERSYSRGTMLPSCPRCNQVFDFKEISGWTNAEYYRKWKEHIKKSGME